MDQAPGHSDDVMHVRLDGGPLTLELLDEAFERPIRLELSDEVWRRVQASRENRRRPKGASMRRIVGRSAKKALPARNCSRVGDSGVKPCRW